MAEHVANFLFDEAIEIFLPEGRDEGNGTRICLCCRRSSRSFDDDGCGICDECLAA
jgi:hypothetical protein